MQLRSSRPPGSGRPCCQLESDLRGGYQVPLSFVERESLLGGGGRLGRRPPEPEHFGQVDQGIPTDREQVGRLREPYRLPGQRLRLTRTALTRQDLGPHAPPHRLREEILDRGSPLAYQAEGLSLLVAALG